MIDPFSGWLLPAMMFALMFAMGLALTPADFRRIAQVPGPVVVGTLLQLVGMPLVGLGLAIAFALPPLVAVGFVVCAACPGGMGSNLFVYFGRAHTALSITLTAAATAATLATLPLWIRAVQFSVGAQAGEVEIPLFNTMVELGGLTVVPVLVGMVVRHQSPSASWLERPLSLLAVLGILFVTLRDSMERPGLSGDLFASSLAPVACLVAVAVGLGFTIPWLRGYGVRDAVTIAIELCVKNILLGIVVVSTSFGVLEPVIPLFLYSALMIPPALLLLAWHRVASRRAEKRSEPAKH